MDDEVEEIDLETLEDAPAEPPPQSERVAPSPSRAEPADGSGDGSAHARTASATGGSPGKPARSNPFLSSPAAANVAPDDNNAHQQDSPPPAGAAAKPAKLALSPDDPGVRRSEPTPGRASAGASGSSGTSSEPSGRASARSPGPAAAEAGAGGRPRSPLFVAAEETAGSPTASGARAPSPVARAVAAAASALASARAVVERREAHAPAAAAVSSSRTAGPTTPAPASPTSVLPLSSATARTAIVPLAPAGPLALPPQPIQGEIDECTFTLRKSREELQRIIGEARNLLKGASERNRGVTPSLPTIAPYRRVSPPKLSPSRAAHRAPPLVAGAAAGRGQGPAGYCGRRPRSAPARSRSPTAEAIAAAKAALANRPRSNSRSPSPQRAASIAAAAAAAAGTGRARVHFGGSRSPSPTRHSAADAETSPDRPSVQVGKVRVSTAAESRVHIEEFEEPGGEYRAQITVVERPRPSSRSSRSPSPTRRTASPALASSSSFVPLSSAPAPAPAPSPAAAALGFHPQARPQPRPAAPAASSALHATAAPLPRRARVDRAVQAEAPPPPPPRPPSPTPSEAPSEFERRLFEFEREKWLARVQEAEARHLWELDDARQSAAAELERVRRECEERLEAKDRICDAHSAELEMLRAEREELAEVSQAARAELNRLSTQFLGETAEADSLRATVARLREELSLVSRVNLELEGQHRRDVQEGATGMLAASDDEGEGEGEGEGGSPLGFVRGLRTALLDWLGRAHEDADARLAPAVAERVLRLAEALAGAALHEALDPSFAPRRPLRHALRRLASSAPRPPLLLRRPRGRRRRHRLHPPRHGAGRSPPSVLAQLAPLAALVPASSPPPTPHPPLPPPSAGPPPAAGRPACMCSRTSPLRTSCGGARGRWSGCRASASARAAGPPPRAWVEILRDCDARRLDLRPFAALFSALDRAAAPLPPPPPDRLPRQRERPSVPGGGGPATIAPGGAGHRGRPSRRHRLRVAGGRRAVGRPLAAPGPAEIRRIAAALPGAEFAGYEERSEGAGVLLFRTPDLSVPLAAAAAAAAATSYGGSPSPARRRPRRRASSASPPPGRERAARLARAGEGAVKLSCLRYAMERCFKHSCPYRGERWHLYTPFQPYALVEGVLELLDAAQERAKAYFAPLAAAAAALLRRLCAHALAAAQPAPSPPTCPSPPFSPRSTPRAWTSASSPSSRPSPSSASASSAPRARLRRRRGRGRRRRRGGGAGRPQGSCWAEAAEGGGARREAPLTEDERGDGALTLLAALGDALSILAAAPPRPAPARPRLPAPDSDSSPASASAAAAAAPPVPRLPLGRARPAASPPSHTSPGARGSPSAGTASSSPLRVPVASPSQLL
eukprot:tig00020943_g16284.t1